MMEVYVMPIIRPSSDLRNNYNEISTICHQTKRPVYITKNGAGDLAVMSIELYELLTDKHILYKELEKGINSLEKGEKISEEELYEELDKI
jgi:prevent-host-death family protein